MHLSGKINNLAGGERLGKIHNVRNGTHQRAYHRIARGQKVCFRYLFLRLASDELQEGGNPTTVRYQGDTGIEENAGIDTVERRNGDPWGNSKTRSQGSTPVPVVST